MLLLPAKYAIVRWILRVLGTGLRMDTQARNETVKNQVCQGACALATS